MENPKGESQPKQVAPQDSEEINEEAPVAGRRLTRRNRGRRETPVDEETKKQDDDFWKNNSLFKGNRMYKFSSQMSPKAIVMNMRVEKMTTMMMEMKILTMR